MRRAALVATVVSGLTVAAALASGAPATSGAAVKLEANLRGANERPAAPATNRGRVELRLTAATGRVCWEFRITRIDGRALQAHIHKGRRGVSGNIVVPLGANYKRQGCTTAAKSLVRAILRSPAAYYVNVHNAKHPLGAMRGQLVREA
jgi:hypothetical protein